MGYILSKAYILLISASRAPAPPRLVALAVCDSLVLSGCFALAADFVLHAAAEPIGIDFYLLYEGGLLQICLVVATVQISLYLARMYDEILSAGRAFQQICLGLGIAFLLQALLALNHSTAEMPRWIMIGGSLLALPIFPVWRIAASAILTRAVPLRKILFLGAPLGSSGPVDEIALLLKQPQTGWAAVGYLGEESNAAVPYLGPTNDFEAAFQEHSPSRIVIRRNANGAPMRRLLELQRMGARVEDLAGVYESLLGRISLAEISPAGLIFSKDLDASPRAVVMRDIYSVLLGWLLLGVSSPLLVIAALSIRRTSPRPVLVREPRVGLGGTQIDLLRFPKRNPAQWIEKFGLTYLPRLLNLACGELAIVGPAPERPEFAQALRERIPFYPHRHSVKPGLIGWAQVQRRKDEITNLLTALEYDFYYIKHLSPALDAYILLLWLRR